MEGIILKALSGFYYVDDGQTVIPCRGRGKLRHAKVTPLVGDRVEFTPLSDGQGALEAVLPRRGDSDRSRFLAHSLRAAIRRAFPDRLPPKFHICVLAYEHIYGPGRRFLDHDNLELKHCQDVLEAAFLTNDTSALCSAFQCSHRGVRNATRIWVLPAEAFPKWLESHRESWAGPPET